VRTTFGRRHNLFVIPHPHFIGIYPRSASREQARSILGIPADAFIYGFFGSIQPYKGIEELIESFRRLPDDDAWLVIAGGNSRQPEYLDTIHERADSLPRIVLRTYQRAPSEELTRVMQASDVIVLPFRATTTSGTLMLALSWGRPVIAPALGCLPMTVPPLAGILYDPTASDPLPQAMTELRRMDLVRASDAAVAAARRFDWDEIAAATLRAYQA
jgi:glycosyltransferase involved in cell wall biosynthesis